MDQNQYHYDFSYSVALDSPLQDELATGDDLNRQFMEWCKIFITLHIFKIDDGQRFTGMLLRLPAFRKLGLQLLQLCVLGYGDAPLEDKNSQAEKCREQIYSHLQELEATAGKQKHKYLNIVIISLYAIIERTLERGTHIQIQDEFWVFHLIYWELKGQLINKQNMENLINSIFVVQEFHRFMYWSKDDLCVRITTTKRDKIKIIQEPLTFRTNNFGGDVPRRSTQMYQSFKQLSIRSEIRNQLKQNTGNNFDKQRDRRQPECAVKADRINFDTFRKKPIPMLNQNEGQSAGNRIQIIRGGKTNANCQFRLGGQERQFQFQFQLHDP